MTKMMLFAYICLLYLTINSCSAHQLLFKDESRHFEVYLNPLCNLTECFSPDENGSHLNLLYVKSYGDNDTLHFFYSNIDSFSVIVFKTRTSAILDIEWSNLISHNKDKILGSIRFVDTDNKTIQIDDAFGYSFPTVYEFNDVNGTANMSLIPTDDYEQYWYSHHTMNLIWKNFTLNTTGDNIGEFIGYPSGANPNGTFRFSIRYQGKSSRDASLPHLLLNRDSASVDFIIDSVEPRFNYTKFGINIVFLTNYETNEYNKTNIDDEYTPGTFKTFCVDSVEHKDNKTVVHNFFEWKPIFYYYDPKALENSTLTKEYSLKDKFQRSPLGIGLTYFEKDKLFDSMNISFGLEGNIKDGYYYNGTSFSSWTFSFGMGSAPEESMSSIVKLIITVGFGLPVAVILVGLGVMIVKKLRYSNRSNFSPL